MEPTKERLSGTLYHNRHSKFNVSRVKNWTLNRSEKTGNRSGEDNAQNEQ